jgi:hypothetical protein
VVDALFILAPHPEADNPPDVVHDGRDVGSHLRSQRIGEDGFITARYIEAHAGWAHLIPVCHDAAYWDCITFMVVRHQGQLVGRLHAGSHLGHSPLVDGRTPNWNTFDDFQFTLLAP